MKIIFFTCAIVLMLCVFAYAADKKRIYGVYEKLTLLDFDNTTIKVKMDTGAKTSSLNAHDIEIFDKDGEEWVRFVPVINGVELALAEMPVARHTLIKRRVSATPHTDIRPVVMLNVLFDKKKYKIEVNLIDRSNFVYSMLIGKTAIITFNAAIDPSKKYKAK